MNKDSDDYENSQDIQRIEPIRELFNKITNLKVRIKTKTSSWSVGRPGPDYTVTLKLFHTGGSDFVSSLKYSDENKTNPFRKDQIDTFNLVGYKLNGLGQGIQITGYELSFNRTGNNWDIDSMQIMINGIPCYQFAINRALGRSSKGHKIRFDFTK